MSLVIGFLRGRTLIKRVGRSICEPWRQKRRRPEKQDEAGTEQVKKRRVYGDEEQHMLPKPEWGRDVSPIGMSPMQF